jgi:predicted nucleic acid-binding protein
MPLEFIDTNILVYAHDGGAGVKHEAANTLIARLGAGAAGALSTQVLIEFYAVGLKKLALSKQEALEIVQDFGTWTVHRLDHADLLAAARLHQRYRISWWDALVLHSAQALGCEVLWTEDFAHGQRYGSVTVRNPFR